MLKRAITLLTFAVAALGAAGCGYTFQKTRNPTLESYGIHKIYVAPLGNDTYKPGVENLVYNELVREIAAHRRVKIVQSRDEADAVLSGQVVDAAFSRAGSTTADNLFPTNTKFPWMPPISKGIQTATSYTASLNCTFSLSVLKTKTGKSAQLWSSGFSRSQPFPANNQVGNFGNTSSIINDSEFDRALAEMARNMMADVHESMLAMF